VALVTRCRKRQRAADPRSSLPRPASPLTEPPPPPRALYLYRRAAVGMDVICLAIFIAGSGGGVGQRRHAVSKTGGGGALQCRLVGWDTETETLLEPRAKPGRFCVRRPRHDTWPLPGPGASRCGQMPSSPGGARQGADTAARAARTPAAATPSTRIIPTQGTIQSHLPNATGRYDWYAYVRCSEKRFHGAAAPDNPVSLCGSPFY
jgi:hypothetical protein